MKSDDTKSLLDELQQRWLRPISVAELLEQFGLIKHLDPYMRVSAPRAYVVADRSVDNGFVARVYDARTGKRVQLVRGLRGSALTDFVRAYTTAVATRKDWQLHIDFDDNHPVPSATTKSGAGEGTVIPRGDGNPRRIDWIGGGYLLTSTPYVLAVSEENVIGPDLTNVIFRMQVVTAAGEAFNQATLSLPENPTAYQVLASSGTSTAWVQATATLQASSMWLRGPSSAPLTIPTGETLLLPLALTATNVPTSGLRIKFDVFSDQYSTVTPQLTPDYWAAPVFSTTLFAPPTT